MWVGQSTSGIEKRPGLMQVCFSLAKGNQAGLSLISQQRKAYNTRLKKEVPSESMYLFEIMRLCHQTSFSWVHRENSLSCYQQWRQICLYDDNLDGKTGLHYLVINARTPRWITGRLEKWSHDNQRIWT